MLNRNKSANEGSIYWYVHFPWRIKSFNENLMYTLHLVRWNRPLRVLFNSLSYRHPARFWFKLLILNVCTLYVSFGAAADHRWPTEHSTCQRSAAVLSLYFLTVTIFSRPNVWTFTNGFRFYCTSCLCTATTSCKNHNTLYCISRQFCVGKSKRWKYIYIFKYLFWCTAIRVLPIIMAPQRYKTF